MQLDVKACCLQCTCRYINHLCELSENSFKCSVCGRSTELKHLTLWHNQYCRYPAARQHLPELQQQCYEVLVDPELQADGLGHHQQQQHQQVGLVIAVIAASAGQWLFLGHSRLASSVTRLSFIPCPIAKHTCRLAHMAGRHQANARLSTRTSAAYDATVTDLLL